MYGRPYWGRYPHWRWGWANHRYNWWGWATVGAVTSWWYFTPSQPVYYSYGDNLYYEGDTVYYEGEAITTAEEYSAQAAEIADNVPENVNRDEAELLPLGVFALTQEGGDVEEATLFLQLAITKEGIIAGTFQNTATDQAFEVEGMVDKESQRAAWGPVDKDWPIIETGIYNLTENQAGALVHFEDGSVQTWELARLDEPEQTSAN